MIRACYSVARDGRIGVIDAESRTRVEEMAMLLVLCDCYAQRCEFAIGCTQQVPLHTHVAEEGCRRPEMQAMLTASRVIALGGNVGSHHLGREEVGEPALNALAIESVIAVTRPDAMRSPEDLEVSACAT